VGGTLLIPLLKQNIHHFIIFFIKTQNKLSSVVKAIYVYSNFNLVENSYE